MKTFSLLFLLLLTTHFVLAQGSDSRKNGFKVRGSVQDSVSGQPIPFASVAVFSTSGNLVMGTTADEQGTFALADLSPGIYTFSVSFVGYQAHRIEAVSIPEAGEKVLSVRLLQMAIDLQEVKITGRKPLYEDKGDRLVYNAEQDIANVGGSAAEVLQKAPLLTVDLEGNVQMRGSSNIKVLLNGRVSGILASNIAMALRQIPASSIKSVEVITSPGARYDAEGTAGIINIITKKKVEGLDGNLYVTVGNLTQATGVNVSLQREKFGISLSGSYYKYRTIETDAYRRENLSEGQVTGSLMQQTEKDNTGEGGNVELIMDYYPDSTEHYTVWMGVWGGNTPNSATLLNQNLNGAGQIVNSYLLDNQIVDYYASTELNLGYTKTYPGKKYPVMVSPRNFTTRTVEKLKETPELSIFGQYNSTPDSLYYLATQSDPGERLLSLERSFNKSMFRELTIQTDYILPFTIGFLQNPNLANFSIGGKAIARSIASNFELETALDDEDDFVNDPTRSNRFAYEQRVLAGYVALWLRSRRNWTFSLGGRAEATMIKGDFDSFMSRFENSYLSLIPTLTLAKSFNRAGTFKVSYTQRIFRPQIGYLNPFINYSDPNNLSTGNPLLDPELAHAFEASHSLFGQKGSSLTTSAFYRNTTGAIEYIREITPSGAALMKPFNIATRVNYGLGVHAALRILKNCNITAGGNWLYQEFMGETATGNAGHVWNTTLTGSYKIGENTTLQANGNYTSGKITFQGRYSSYYGYGFSARQEFWNKRGNLTLSVNNPLQRGVVQRSEFEAPDFRANNTNLVVSRWGRLTFYWHFLQARELRWRESRKVVNDDKVKVSP